MPPLLSLRLYLTSSLFRNSRARLSSCTSYSAKRHFAKVRFNDFSRPYRARCLSREESRSGGQIYVSRNRRHITVCSRRDNDITVVSRPHRELVNRTRSVELTDAFGKKKKKKQKRSFHRICICKTCSRCCTWRRKVYATIATISARARNRSVPRAKGAGGWKRQEAERKLSFSPWHAWQRS